MSALENAEKLAELSSIREHAVGAGAAVTRLRELLEDGDPEVRAEAAESAFGYPGDPDLVQKLIGLARDDPQETVRVRALQALGAVVREGDLLGAAGDDYAPAEGLGAPSAAVFAEVRDLLLARVEGGPEAERHGAVLSLSYLSGEASVVQAIEGLAKADETRALAIQCMGRSGDPRWAETVEGALDDGQAKVVAAAIAAAGRIELTGAVSLLSRIVRGSRQPTPQRVRAAEALGRLGGEATSGVLLEVASDDGNDEAVREAANRALTGLTLLTPARNEEE